MKVVIPMAGRGSRFKALAHKNPQFTKPKPLIPVKGEPMIVWAVIKTFPNVALKDFIFILLQKHQENHQIIDKLRHLFGSAPQTKIIPQITRGAAETALAADELLDPQEEIIIADSDQYLDTSPLLKAIKEKKGNLAGLIPVDRPPDKEIKHSYTLTDKNNKALAVAEKDPELAARGAWANIGAYYFSHWQYFAQTAHRMIAEKDLHGTPGKKEFYVAPIYQRLIEKGLKVKVVPTQTAWRLGTPQDLAYFEKTTKLKNPSPAKNRLFLRV